MIPGMNPRDVAKAMKRMGVQQQDIEAEKVVIFCKDKKIIFENPQVAKVNMMGQASWQITGNSREENVSDEPEINEDDIKTIIEQTGKTEKEAEKALQETKGDIAQAILNLSE